MGLNHNCEYCRYGAPVKVRLKTGEHVYVCTIHYFRLKEENKILVILWKHPKWEPRDT